MKHRALVLENAAGEGPGVLEEILLENNWTIHRVHLYRGQSIPSNWQSHDLLVVMGGPMNVYEEDRFPYLAKETSVIREALEADMPTLGFCLGAQLMAKAADAGVHRGSKREIGWHRVWLTAQAAEDPLLKSLPLEFTVFQWHGDTFDVPTGGVRVVSSQNYLNQGMRLGSLSYGFQFHVEVTEAMITRWLVSYKNEVQEMGEPGLAERVRRDTTIHLAGVHKLSASLFRRYLDLTVER